MKVILLERDMEESYEEFLSKHREALLYYSIKYRDFLVELLDCEPLYLLAMNKGEIRGILPLMRKKGSYGYIYNSLPFYGGYGGVIADNKEAFSFLYDEYNSLINKDSVGASTIVSNPLIKEHHCIPKHNEIDERIGQFTELLFDKNSIEDALFSKIDSSARRNIKKAIRSGIKIKVDNTKMTFLKDIHYENMEAIGGRPKPERFFNLIDKHFEDRDYKLYVASLDDEPIAALLLFYYDNVVEYFVPAIVNEFRTYQPLALIVYSAMIDSAKRGYTLWNWGGTWLTQDGVYRFKKKWASLERRYLYYIYIKNLKIYEASKKDLMNEYNNFYVVPFDKLKGGCDG
jgi:hypothetical protein